MKIKMKKIQIRETTLTNNRAVGHRRLGTTVIVMKKAREMSKREVVQTSAREQ